VGAVLDFSRFVLNEDKIGSFYNDELNPKFWDKYKNKNGETQWVFDRLVRKKLLKIAEDFYEKYSDLLGDLPIEDIQLTGSLANFNYTDKSDLDVHVLVDFNKVKSKPEMVKAAVDGIRFVWNLRHDVVIRNHDVELYLQNIHEPHTASGLYSLLNDKWIRKPKFDPPEVDEQDVRKKFDGLASEINQMESKLVTSSSLPKDAKEMYKRLIRLKEKIQKMRKDGLSKDGEFSIGNLAFKMLRNEGYISKLIDLISKAYARIYSE
jgi:hypothetical protein